MMPSSLQTGDLVTARGREWIVLSKPAEGLVRIRPLSGSEAQLAARRAWRFDAEISTVDRGAAIYDIPLPPWTEGRADFVWHALRSIDLNAATAGLSQPEQVFIAQAAAA